MKNSEFQEQFSKLIDTTIRVYESENERLIAKSNHLGELYNRAITENATLEAALEQTRKAVRYALATFRALDQYTFEDSDHGLLIRQAVSILEDATDPTTAGETTETAESQSQPSGAHSVT